jgi:hypothetical protein
MKESKQELTANFSDCGLHLGTNNAGDLSWQRRYFSIEIKTKLEYAPVKSMQ